MAKDSFQFHRVNPDCEMSFIVGDDKGNFPFSEIHVVVSNCDGIDDARKKLAAFLEWVKKGYKATRQS